MVALRDGAATFIARLDESFRFLGPTVFRDCRSVETSYLHVDSLLFRKPGSAVGDDMLDGIITHAEIRPRSAWSGASPPPWSVCAMACVR